MKAKLLLASILCASVAHAASKPLDVYSIWYASDESQMTEVETFHGCLMTASSFGTWGQLWNVGPITMHPAIVLSTSAPNPLQVGTSLETAINAAITASKIPAPTANNNTIYVVHGPSGVTNNASDATHLCYNNQSCGEHGPGLYNGKYYQAALVPLDCPLCGGTLKTATWIGMHEIAEAAADEGTAKFEVGDQCEAAKNLTQLQCCGSSYTIQQLDTPTGPGACQTIDATGSMCGCGVVQSACSADAGAGACCSGMVCQPWVAKIGDPTSNACCWETGQTCTGTNDCCGGLACTAGKCTCEAIDQFCLRDADCCDGHCNATSQKCEAPPQPDAGADASVNDATADGGTEPPPESGCSCREASSRSNTWPLALFAIGAAFARRRRLSRR